MITRKYRCHVKWEAVYDNDIGELPTTFYTHLSFDKEPTDEEIGHALSNLIIDEVSYIQGDYCIFSFSYEEV